MAFCSPHPGVRCSACNTVGIDLGPTELTALRERVDGLHEELQAAHEVRKRAEKALEEATAHRDQAWTEQRDTQLLLHSKSRLWKWLHR